MHDIREGVENVEKPKRKITLALFMRETEIKFIFIYFFIFFFLQNPLMGLPFEKMSCPFWSLVFKYAGYFTRRQWRSADRLGYRGKVDVVYLSCTVVQCALSFVGLVFHLVFLLVTNYQRYISFV